MKKLLVIFIFILLAFTIAFGQRSADKTVTIAAVENQPYITAVPDSQGYIAEIVRAVFTELGYNVQYKFFAQEQLNASLSTGQYDFVLKSTYDSDLVLAKNDSFIEIDELEIELLRKKGSKTAYSNLESLKNKSVGITRDFPIPDTLSKISGLMLKQAVSTQDNIDRLMAGAYPFILEYKDIAHAVYETKYPGKQLLQDVDILQTIKFYLGGSGLAADKKSLLNLFRDKLVNYKAGDDYFRAKGTLIFSQQTEVR